MAILHRATLQPTKLEILAAWVPSQNWAADAATGPLSIAGSYRFDDPAGEVGIETMLLATAAGTVLQVPLTYRAQPLAGAQSALLGTTEHSVLGRRWVYDGCADPVYVQALVTVVLTGGAQAELRVMTEDGYEIREPQTVVRGSGSSARHDRDIVSARRVDEGTSTLLYADGLAIRLLRTIGEAPPAGGSAIAVLTGTWPGRDSPALLASVQPLPPS